MTPTLFQLPTTTDGTVIINADDVSHIKAHPTGAVVVCRTGYAWTSTLTPEEVAGLIADPTP